MMWREDPPVTDANTPNTAPEPAIFEIPEENLHGLEDKLKKLAKRAAKLGVGEITWETLSTRTEPIMVCSVKRYYGSCNCAETFTRCNLVDSGRVRVWHKIEVKGDSPVLPGGWRLVAAIEPLTPEVNAVLRVPGDETPLDAEFWSCEMRCDHCKTKRARKNSFLVADDAGEVKLVGRNCIKDFLGGHGDPEAILKFASMLLEARRLGGFAEEDGWGGGNSYAEPTYGLVGLLAMTSACIRAGGWISRGKARESTLDATADDVLRRYAGPPKDSKERAAWEKWAALREVNDEDRADAEAAVEWAAAIDIAADNTSDYMRNIGAVAKAGYGVEKTIGLACSILPVFRRERDKLAREAARAEESTSRHVGEVGSREVFTLTLDKHMSFEGFYGVTHLYLFSDADGNKFKWKASRGQGFDEGKTYSGKATVKAHDDYKGIAQTVITRASLKEVTEVPAAA